MVIQYLLVYLFKLIQIMKYTSDPNVEYGKSSKIIALANHKGGVGKTTISYNLSFALARDGYKVLALDIDPQASLTKLFHAESDYTIVDFLIENSSGFKPVKVDENIDLVVGSSYLEKRAKELYLNSRLRSKIYKGQLNRAYDFIVIDCPPAGAELTINALSAATGVLIPLKPEFLAYEGLGTINEMIAEVKENVNNELSVIGIVYNDVEPRRVITKQIKELVNEQFGSAVFTAEMSHYVSFTESPLEKLPVFEYEKYSKPGTEQFLNFYKEFKQRLDIK